MNRNEIYVVKKGLPLLAVYGTLKRGKGNHERYLKNCRFVGEGRTVNKYVLVDNGIPFCVPPEVYGSSDKATNIKVEVYEIPEEKLWEIDALEGHPDWYVRKKIKITMDNGNVVEAWFYEYPHKVLGKIIESGEW